MVSKTMEELVSLCKRRGFIFQSNDIYGGVKGLYDYGPMGVELKNKFGKKTKIKMIEPKKSFIQRKLSSNLSSSLIDSSQLIAYLEEKAYWSRYGL